jgi:hypothetical protein
MKKEVWKSNLVGAGHSELENLRLGWKIFKEKKAEHYKKCHDTIKKVIIFGSQYKYP